MQNANASIASTECFKALGKGSAAHELGNILSSRLPSLHKAAYRVLGNRADAEDAVQDALLAAHKHLKQFQGRSQMSTWLTAIVHNAARMQLRKRLRHIHVSLDAPIGETSESLSLADRVADKAPTPEEECCGSELDNHLRGLTAKLSPTLLRTFQLRDVEGLSIRETAEILGIPNGTVKAQSARARKKLKELMSRALRLRSHNLTGASKPVCRGIGDKHAGKYSQCA